jgi:hypothetical protein
MFGKQKALIESSPAQSFRVKRHGNDKIGERNVILDERAADQLGERLGNIADKSVFEIVHHFSRGGILVGNGGDQGIEMRFSRFPAGKAQKAFVGDTVFASGTDLKIQRFHLRKATFAQPKTFSSAREAKNREKRIEYDGFQGLYFRKIGCGQVVFLFSFLWYTNFSTKMC